MIRKCPTCGHRINPRAEKLSKGLIDALIVFVKAVKIKRLNEIHLQRDVNFNKTQYNNFQKLRYHALVFKTDQPGCWGITRLGGKFLRNEIEIAKTIYIQNNRIIAKGDDFIKINDYFNGAYKDDYWQKEFDLNIEQSKLL